MNAELYNMFFSEKVAKRKRELRQIQIAEKMTAPLLKPDRVFTAYPSRLVFTPHNIRFIPSGNYSSDLLLNRVTTKREIRDFSAKSRRNFANKLDCCTFKGRLFITLTYPRECVPTFRLHDFSGVSAGRSRKVYPLLKPCDLAFAQCKAFMRAVDRLTYQWKHNKKPLWFWKREFQNDGTIHFHLLTDLIPYAPRYSHSKWFYKGKGRKGYFKKARSKSFSWELLPADFIAELQTLWCHIIGERVTLKNNSMDIAPVRSVNGSVHYMTKYIDKENECTVCPPDCINLGRYWGIQNRKFYEKIEPIIIKLPTVAAERVRSFLHFLLDSQGFPWRDLLRSRGYVKEEWFKPVDDIRKKADLMNFLNCQDVYLRSWSHSIYNNYTDL